MSNKETILKKIQKALNNAASRVKSPDLSTFCINMLEANKFIDELSDEYKNEKNTKSITQRYFNFSSKNKESPLQIFNGIVTFCKDPKNKQIFFARLFSKASSIITVSRFVKRALENFNYIMNKTGGEKTWKRIIKFNNENKEPISYEIAAVIYDGMVHGRDKDGKITILSTSTADEKEKQWLPPICQFFGYEEYYDGKNEYSNIYENVSNVFFSRSLTLPKRR